MNFFSSFLLKALPSKYGTEDKGVLNVVFRVSCVIMFCIIQKSLPLGLYQNPLLTDINSEFFLCNLPIIACSFSKAKNMVFALLLSFVCKVLSTIYRSQAHSLNRVTKRLTFVHTHCQRYCKWVVATNIASCRHNWGCRNGTRPCSAKYQRSARFLTIPKTT